MKRSIWVLFLMGVFLWAFCCRIWSEELTRVDRLKTEIVQLEKKLAVAKTKTRKARIQKQIAQYRAEIAKLQAVSSAAPVKLEQVDVKLVDRVRLRRAVLIEGGLGGGAGMITLGYTSPLSQDTSFLISAGYGIGNGFSAPKIGVGAIYRWNNGVFASAELTAAAYSKSVKNLVGRNDAPEGTSLGVGVASGTYVGPVFVNAGYNTILGVTANVGYRIFM